MCKEEQIRRSFIMLTSTEHGEASRTVRVDRGVLDKNDQLAEYNRGWLAGRRVLALNLVSSPGAGKTTLLERTVRDLAREVHVSVIEGDQETDHDAQRIRAAGCRAVQIQHRASAVTSMQSLVARGLEELDPPLGSIVFIENVGNAGLPGPASPSIWASEPRSSSVPRPRVTTSHSSIRTCSGPPASCCSIRPTFCRTSRSIRSDFAKPSAL